MPDSRYYLWNPPGSPAAVELSLQVIDKLTALLRQTTIFVEPTPAHRPLETGGILLGRRLESGAVAVDDLEEVPSEHRKGASFALTALDRTHLAQQLNKLAKRGRTVVGYFRTHTRQGMYLDHYDEAVIRQYFSDPWQVVLLAKPEPGEVPSGGFFFWEEGQMDLRQTCLPFPLDRWTLTSKGYSIVLAQPPTVPAVHESRTGTAGALGVFALTAAIVILGVLGFAGIWQRSHKRPPAALHRPAPVVTETKDTWELPESPAPAPVKRAPPKVAFGPAVVSQSAVGPAPPTEKNGSAAAPVEDSVRPIVSPAKQPARSSMRLQAAHPQALHPDVSLEPVRHSALHTAFGRIPLVSRLDRDRNESSDDFVPARPRQEHAPTVPPELSRDLTTDEPVVLRIRIAKNGEVSKTELISRKANPAFASLALQSASQWDFDPARVGNKPVPSDMLVHFRFRAPR